MKETMGRPKVPDNKKKSHQIFVNLTEEEKKKLYALAEKEGLSLSQLGRIALKKARFI